MFCIKHYVDCVVQNVSKMLMSGNVRKLLTAHVTRDMTHALTTCTTSRALLGGMLAMLACAPHVRGESPRAQRRRGANGGSGKRGPSDRALSLYLVGEATSQF